MEKKEKMSIKVEGYNKKTVSELKSIIKRTDTENPKPKDLEVLRKEFEDKPELYRSIGNLNKGVFNTILESAVGKSVLVRESTQRFIKEMKSELGYETSTFVEKMLIDEIILRWLRLLTVENDHHKILNERHTLEVGIYYDKRLSTAQHRYLKSIETLAKVRKMIAQTQAKGAKMFKDLMTSNEK